MFWVRIDPGGREYLGVLDTGATISMVAKNILRRRDLKNIMPTAAIRMGDDHVVHSSADCDVDVPMRAGSIADRFNVMNSEAFYFVLGTDFFAEHPKTLSPMLQGRYGLHVHHGEEREPVPLEQSEHLSSYLRVCKKEPSAMMVSSETEHYQLLGAVLDQDLKELRYSREDLNVELFTSDKQHVLDLYCSKGQTCCCKLYRSSVGMAYGNPRFRQFGKVRPKVALELSLMVLCSPDGEAHGGNEYLRTLLEKQTLISTKPVDAAIYVPLGRKTPFGKPGRGGYAKR